MCPASVPRNARGRLHVRRFRSGPSASAVPRRRVPNLARAWRETVRNSDDTVSILTTDVDTAVEDGSPAAQSRTYAVAAQQIFKNALGLEPACSYNAELVTQVSPGMRVALHR
jgi:hypothetical protein